jgi:AcrR family transcriptional regulator
VKRVTKRSEQKEKRRQDIHKAALNLFIRKGYEATKISDIAEKVGMSVGLLYHYFKSTEDLYNELVTLALMGRSGQHFPPFDNPLDFFSKTAEFIFNMIKENPYIAEFFVLTTQAQKNPNLPQDLKDKLGENDVIEKSTRLIVEGQHQGVFREGNPLALALAFWLSIQGYMEMIALNPDTPHPESDWFVNIIRK